MKNINTHIIHFEDNDGRVLELAKESAQVYNQTLDIYWKHCDNGKHLSKKDLHHLVNIPRELLHSQSYQASRELAYDAISSYFKSIKAYKNNPESFSGKPRPPKKHKNIQKIVFKESAIRCRKKRLLLSIKNGHDPLIFRWNGKLSKPFYATITWKRETGWQLNLSFKKERNIHEFVEDKLMSVDLGVKRIATLFDAENVVTMSGKIIMSLNRLRSKINAMTSSQLSRLNKHSRRYRKIKSANRKFARRINNRIKDILHKYSRTVVNHCVSNDVGTIVVGDCADIHHETNLGKKNNQKVQQNPEQRLLKYVKEKFEAIGGNVEVVSEAYTSRTCPSCGHVRKSSPSGRTFSCNKCSFQYDRDGVGAINIYKKVSFGSNFDLNVVGGLTPPIGYKFNSNRNCLVHGS